MSDPPPSTLSQQLLMNLLSTLALDSQEGSTGSTHQQQQQQQHHQQQHTLSAEEAAWLQALPAAPTARSAPTSNMAASSLTMPSTPVTSTAAVPQSSTPSNLPVDHHASSILKRIASQRVSIIEGETGCGKSSRVPILLHESNPKVRMFISQPRRIAASTLLNRVSSTSKTPRVFGLRLGHGIRTETSETRIWFCTTGYLVRLLAHHPDSFNDHTHLIIDEVHERSVDTDVLCLLVKRLLQTNKTIRVVLMSATLSSSLYTSYFGDSSDKPMAAPISIQVRQHPIKISYVNDLIRSASHPSIKGLLNSTYSLQHPSAFNAMKGHQYDLTLHLITSLAGRAMNGGSASSVLVFVPGMSDIVEIMTRFDEINLNATERSFLCLPIHSDIPYEDQLLAFQPVQPGVTKIVIATNAAESGITLPDVDVVIDFGMSKQIDYNPDTHRQVLAPVWVSKASAKQRAGRTGRVRPGRVIRLYTKNHFESLDDVDRGEILRTPLDAVILNLKEMLGEGEICPVLQECIEAPDVTNIQASFNELFNSGLITTNDDVTNRLTEMGAFVTKMGLDIAVGRFIGLCCQCGLLEEGLYVAAVISSPKLPWRIGNPLLHEPESFNDISKQSFLSKASFDRGTRSDVFQCVYLMIEYEKVKMHEVEDECESDTESESDDDVKPPADDSLPSVSLRGSLLLYRVAHCKNLEPSSVISDEAVEDIAANLPTTIQELKRSKFMGKKKCEKHGDAIVDLVKKSLGTPEKQNGKEPSGKKIPASRKEEPQKQQQQKKKKVTARSFCKDFSLAASRLSSVMSVVRSLRERVSRILKIPSTKIKPLTALSHSKIVILKVVMTWVFTDQIMRCSQKPAMAQKVVSCTSNSGKTFTLPLANVVGDVKDTTDQILGDAGLEYSLRQKVRRQFNAAYDCDSSLVFENLDELAARAMLCGVEAIVFVTDMFVEGAEDEDVEEEEEEEEEFSEGHTIETIEMYHLASALTLPSETRRSFTSVAPSTPDGYTVSKLARKKGFKTVVKKTKEVLKDSVCLIATVTESQVNISVKGAASITALELEKIFAQCSLEFGEQIMESSSVLEVTRGRGEDDAEGDQIENFVYAGMCEVPLAVSLLTCLCLGRRKEYKIKGGQGEIEFTIPLKPANWTFLDQRQGGMCFVPDNSLVSATYVANQSIAVYGIAGVRMDIAGGSAKADLITALPVNCAFLEKCFLTFGADEQLVDEVRSGDDFDEKRCIRFRDMCGNLGEEPVCELEVVKELCKIFGVKLWRLKDNVCLVKRGAGIGGDRKRGQAEAAEDEFEEEIVWRPR
jgi:HrpA-like RNA helicase